MRREDNLMLCTVEELSDFIAGNISGLGEKLPTHLMTLKARCDFAVVYAGKNDDGRSLHELYLAACGWYGINEEDTPFDQDCCEYIDLVTGHYGGGPREHVTIWRETEGASLDIARIIKRILEIEEHADDSAILIVEVIPNY